MRSVLKKISPTLRSWQAWKQRGLFCVVGSKVRYSLFRPSLLLNLDFEATPLQLSCLLHSRKRPHANVSVLRRYFFGLETLQRANNQHPSIFLNVGFRVPSSAVRKPLIKSVICTLGTHSRQTTDMASIRRPMRSSLQHLQMASQLTNVNASNRTARKVKGWRMSEARGTVCQTYIK